jgi:hypothetical protein
MKALPTSRSELRWLAIAIPSVFVAHWLFISIGPRVVQLLPYSLRAVMHLF